MLLYPMNPFNLVVGTPDLSTSAYTSSREWEDGRLESTRICLPPTEQLHWQDLSDVIILELWSLLEACNFQGEDLDTKLLLILVRCSS